MGVGKPDSACQWVLPLGLHGRPDAVSVQLLLPPHLPDRAAHRLGVSGSAVPLGVPRDGLNSLFQVVEENLSLWYLIF